MNASQEITDHSSQEYERFLRLFAEEQLRVLAYILALVHDRNDAQDIFQETSLILWREFATYDATRPFLPWALGVARNQVLKFWRTRKRDQHLFSGDVMESLAVDAGSAAVEQPARDKALAECMKQLPDRQRQLVEWFYGKNLSAGEIADRWDRSVHAVYKALRTMRRALFQCVQRRMSTG